MRLLTFLSRIILTFLYCLCIYDDAYGKVQLISDKYELQYIGKEISFLIDKNGEYTIERIVKSNPSFERSTKEILNFNLINHPVWLKFTIDSKLPGEYFINLDNPNIDSLFIFYPLQNGNYQCHKMGYQFPLRQNATTFFSGFKSKVPTDLPAGESTIYIQIVSKELMYLPISIGNPDSIQTANSISLFLDALYIGLFLAMLLYNTFIYFSTRDKTYLYYMLYIACNFIYMFFIKGFGLFMPDFLKKFLGDYNNSMVALAEITFILFSISFLNVTKNQNRSLYRLFITFIYICFFVIALDLLGYEVISAIIVEINLLLASIIMIPTAIYIGKKAHVSARLYIVGLVTFLFCLITYVITLFGIIPFTSFSLHILPFGCSVEVIMLSLALGDKINKLQKDKTAAEKENFELIKKQNQKLEAMVFERTIELEETNIKLATQNELIEAQKASIEQEVALKTVQLKEALDIVLKKNQDLQQFSYIISHNLRSPIASILGLVSIYKRNHHSNPDNVYIIDKLSNSVSKLDTVITDLNSVISVRDSTFDKTLEKINIHELIKNICEGLHAEIELSETTINIEIDTLLTIKSVKGYLYSVVYNLISNAIKYRNPEKKSNVSISVKEAKGGIHLSVTDNGLGINLDDKESIFMLYKRFHTHVEGKGLGLYLVKTQVESLKGTIDVEGGIDGGTRFNIFLPN